MAKTLIENLTAEWQPEEFTDDYREGLLKIVEAKIAGEEIELGRGGAHGEGGRPDGRAEGERRCREEASER